MVRATRLAPIDEFHLTSRSLGPCKDEFGLVLTKEVRLAPFPGDWCPHTCRRSCSSRLSTRTSRLRASASSTPATSARSASTAVPSTVPSEAPFAHEHRRRVPDVPREDQEDPRGTLSLFSHCANTAHQTCTTPRRTNRPSSDLFACLGQLEVRLDPQGPRGPSRRDHRPRVRQDGHQRAELGRQGLHGRL